METQNLPHTRAEKSAQTRQAIISAARTLLQKSEYTELTVRNICQLADVSTGTFYHFFQSKDDLLSVFLHQSAKGSPDRSNEIGLLEYIIECYMDVVDQYYELGLGFASHFFNAKNQAFNTYTRRPGGFAVDLYAVKLVQARAKGYVCSDIPIDTILQDIQVIVVGNMFEWCVVNGRFDLKADLARLLRGYLEGTVFTDAYFEKYPRKNSNAASITIFS